MGHFSWQEVLTSASRRLDRLPVGRNLQIPWRCINTPSFLWYPSPLSSYIGMSGSAVVDIRDTYGLAFIGLLLSTLCVFSPPLPFALLIRPTYSLYGVTIIQT